MATIASIFVDLQANSASFARDMGKASEAARSSTSRINQSLARTQRQFGRWQRSVKSSIGQMVSLRGAIATVAGTAGLGLLVKNSIAAADSIGKVADRVGFSTKALQELQFAAKQVGVETQRTVNLGLQRFSRRVAEAASGSGELRDTLEKYNIQLRDNDGRLRSNVALLKDLADAVKGAESEQEQLRIAFKAFDSEGAALVNLLRQGAIGIEEFQDKAARFGVVMEESLIRQAEVAQSRLDILSDVLRKQLTVAVVNSADEIQRLADVALAKLPSLIEGTARAVSFLANNIEILTTAAGAFIGLKLGAAFGFPFLGSAIGAVVGLASAWIGATEEVKTHKDALDGLLDKQSNITQELRRQLEVYQSLTDQATGLTVDQQIAGLDRQIASLQQERERVQASLNMVPDSLRSTDPKNQRLAELDIQIKAAREEQERLLASARAAARSTRDLGAATSDFVINALGEGGSGGLPQVSDEMKALGDRVVSISDEIQAFRQNQVEQTNAMAKQARQAEILAKVLETQGRDAYERVKGQIDLLNTAQRLNIDITSEQGAKWAENFRRVQDSERRMREFREQQEKTSKSTQRLTVDIESMSEIAVGSLREMGRSIQSTVTDAFDRLFDGQINSFGDFWDEMVNVARRGLANLAGAIATQKLIIPMFLAPVANGASSLLGGGGGGLGGGSNILSTGSQLADLGGFNLGSTINNLGFSSGIFGAGTSGSAGALNLATSVGANGFNVAGASAAAPASATGAFGATASLSTVLGAAGIGALGGGLLAKPLGLNPTGASIGGGLGAGAGALIGSAIPGIGTIAGGIIGGLAGGGLGGLFGGSEPSRAISTTINDINGQAREVRRVSDEASEEQQRAFTQLTQNVSRQINSFVQSLDAELRGIPAIGLGQTRREGAFARVIRQGGRGFETVGGFGDPGEAAEFALRRSLQFAQFEGLSSDIEDAIRKGLREGRSLESVAQEAQRLRQRDQISLQAELGVRQNVFGAASGIQQFLDAQRLTEGSTLSPAERLQEAQSQFQSRLQDVRGGDIGATQGLIQSAQSLLGFGRDQFASTVSFANLEQSVRSQLAQVGQTLTSDSFINDQVTTAIQQQTTAQLDSDQATRDTINDLKREIRLLNQKLDDVTAQAA